PVLAGRRAAFEPPGAGRARRGGAGRLGLAGYGVRDRPAGAVLRQPHRRPLRASGPERHRDLLSLQGHDQRLLVGPGRRNRAQGPGLGLRLPDPPAAAHRRPGRLLQREGRHLPRRRATGPPADTFLPNGREWELRRRCTPPSSTTLAGATPSAAPTAIPASSPAGCGPASATLCRSTRTRSP